MTKLYHSQVEFSSQGRSPSLTCYQEVVGGQGGLVRKALTSWYPESSGHDGGNGFQDYWNIKAQGAMQDRAPQSYLHH